MTLSKFIFCWYNTVQQTREFEKENKFLTAPNAGKSKSKHQLLVKAFLLHHNKAGEQEVGGKRKLRKSNSHL
jgi:hypothetical protein